MENMSSATSLFFLIHFVPQYARNVNGIEIMEGNEFNVKFRQPDGHIDTGDVDGDGDVKSAGKKNNNEKKEALK